MRIIHPYRMDTGAYRYLCISYRYQDPSSGLLFDNYQVLAFAAPSLSPAYGCLADGYDYPGDAYADSPVPFSPPGVLVV